MTALLSLNALSKIDQNDSKALEFEFLNNFESAHTRKAYKRDILFFLKFYREVMGIGSLADCKRLHIVAFKNYMTEAEFTPKTINRRMSSVSSYFQFLMEKEFVDFNPCDGVKRPKQVVTKDTNDLTDEEVIRLFDVISTEASPLHKAILVTFFTTGIRKSELIEIRRSDLQEVNGDIVLNVIAKGGKRLSKLLIPECLEAIQEYMIDMENQNREIHPNDWLFQPSINPKDPSHTTRPLVASSIDYIFKKYCKKAEIFKNVSPHSARATYIGSSLEAGSDLLKVSKDVGHASIKTTELYNKRKNTLKDSPAKNLGFMKKSA